MEVRFLLLPKDLNDLNKFESGTKIADINNEKGFGAFIIKKRAGIYSLEFLWLPKQGYSSHLDCYKNISKMSDAEFKDYVIQSFNILITENN